MQYTTMLSYHIRLTDNSGEIYAHRTVTEPEYERLQREAAEQTAGNCWWELDI